MDWAEKYRPLRLADIIGNTSAVRQVAQWARAWSRQAKPLLLYGKPGTGKTSCAHALASDMGWEAIELNASDQRTAAVIERIAGGGSTTASLTGSGRKLVILDEADNLQGTADRGGARAMLECIRSARQPMLLIANDLYGIPPEIRLRCEPVLFKAIPARSIAPHLRFICAAENIVCTDEAVRTIAESAEGDVRSAINMLYASAVGRQRLDDTQVHTSQKDERISIFSLIAALGDKTSDQDLLMLSREVEDTPETIVQWIEGNIHLLVKEASIRDAYRHLARADEYIGYTYRRQYHTLWRYANAVMLLGVADVASGKGVHARIMPPARWQKMSGAKKQKAIRNALLNKVSSMMHIPQNSLREEYLGIFSLLVENDPFTFTQELAMDAESLNFFLNDKAKSQEIVRKAALEIREREQQKEKEAAPKKPARNGSPEPEDPRPDQKGPEKKQPTLDQVTLFGGFSRQ
jgi:replication factor C large subunit